MRDREVMEYATFGDAALHFLVAVTIIAVGVCLGVTGAFAVDRWLHADEYPTEWGE